MLMTGAVHEPDFFAMHCCTFSFSFVSTPHKHGNRSGESVIEKVYECE